MPYARFVVSPVQKTGATMIQQSAGPVRRVEKKEATRQHLIAATIDCIAASGFADTTLSKVSAKAEVSRGLVNFHFESKEQLLVETLRHLTEEYLAFWRKAVAQPDVTPAERLRALIEADFHPQVCNRKKIAVWYAFWGEARSRPVYTQVSAKADVAYAQTLENICREIVAEGGYAFDPKMAAKGLRSLIDGQWQDLLMSPSTFDRNEAKQLCLRFAAAIFPKHFEALS